MQSSPGHEHVFEPVVRLTAVWKRGGAWLGPAWAVLCGIVASESFSWQGNAVISMLVALIIAEGLWTTLWAALAETDWIAPLKRWRDWQDGTPVRQLPFTQPGSASERMSVLLGHFRDWARRDLLPNYGNALASAIIAPGVAVVLSALLGAPVVLLTILAISIAQLALLLARGSGEPNSVLRGMVEITLPVLLGFALFKPLTLEVAALAIGFGVAYGGAAAARWNTVIWNAGQGLVLLLLVITRHSVGAFIVALLWLPQFLLQAQPSARRAQFWLMAAMLVASFTLA